MSEETPTPPPGDVPPAPVKDVETDEILGTKRAKKSFLQRIGASGLSVSIAFHALLVFVAAAYVVSTVTDNAKKDPNQFATGAGGSNGGERSVQAKAKQKPNTPKSLTKSASKITSKSASAQIALPEMPDLNRTMVGALSA